MSRRSTFFSGLAVALLIAFLMSWLGLDWFHQGNTDFGNAYAVAQILKSRGFGPEIYDPNLQLAYQNAARAPDHRDVIHTVFMDVPSAALVAYPFTVFDVRTGWRIWSAIQIMVLVIALAMIAFEAPWPKELTGTTRVILTGIAACGIGTWVLMIEGQWAAFFVMGIAIAYRCLRRNKLFLAGFSLVTPLFVVKPNFAIGMVAFLVGWRNWRLLAGAAVSGLLVGGICLCMVGLGGLHALLQVASNPIYAGPWSSGNGLVGLVTSWLGASPLVLESSLILSLVAALVALPLGMAVARDRSLLEIGLAGSICLSLLASPHLYHHDLTLLSPALLLALVAAARVDAKSSPVWPGRIATTILIAWFCFIVIGFEQIYAPVAGPPGRIVPWFLLASSVAGCLVCSTNYLTSRKATVRMDP